MKKLIVQIVFLFVYACNLNARVISYTNHVLQDSTFTISETGSYLFVNQGVYNYIPTSVPVSSPMLKITASDVTVDFQNIGITNQDNSHSGWVGIEIGWSPQELLDDSSRIQPKNIIIKDLSLYNFDCGLIIHAGVESVSIENCKFYETFLGIGVFGTVDALCRNINFNNVYVFGISGNYQPELQDFKTKIEVDFAYGTDYFMTLKADPLYDNNIDVCTYYGICLKYTQSANLKFIKINNIGYEQYASMSEGDGYRTEAVSMYIHDSRRIKVSNLEISDTTSEIKAVGLQLDNIDEITIDNSDISYSQSAVKSVGIEVTNNTSQTYSVTGIFLNNVSTKSNNADEIAIGMDLSSVRGLEAYDILSKFNIGGLQAYGVYAHTMYTVDIVRAKFSENSTTRTTNDVATTNGIIAAGFWAENVHSFQQEHVDFTSMQALNSAYGLYLKDSTSCKFINCQFIANTATTMRSGEAAAIRTAQDSQEISMSAPAVSETQTGGYGALLFNCLYVKFDRCTANSNKGHRAFGIAVRNSRAVGLWETFASTQAATGSMFDSSLLTEITDPTVFPIVNAHKSLLFGDSSKTTVDIITTTDLFLEKLQAIRTAQGAATQPAYSDLVAFLATKSLLKATLARYRLWGVAAGIHAHNVSGFLLNNCTSVGQLSLYDNSYGMCFSGRNAGHSIQKCDLSYNVAGYVSQQTVVNGASYSCAYNIIGLKPFWDMILQQQVPWTVYKSADVLNNVTVVAFSPDKTKLSIGTGANDVQIYNTSDWSLEQTLTGHTAPITSLSWKVDGSQLASGSSSSSDNIKIWNTATWLADQTLTHGSIGVQSVDFRIDGTQLASGSLDVSDNIKVWNTTTWIADQTLTHGSVGVYDVVFSQDESKLASGSGDTSNNIKIWNTSTWVADQTLNSHTAAVKTLDWNNDGSLLASGSEDDLVKIWETSGWSVSDTVSPASGDVNSVAFKPDGSLLAVGCANNIVQIYKVADASLQETLSDFSDAVTSLSWLSNGRLLATGSNDDLYRAYTTDIYKKASSTSDVGLYNEGGSYVLQDSLIFSDAITGDSNYIDLTGTKRPFVTAVSPIGSGIVIADLMVEAVVKQNRMYGNIAHAGQVVGALCDNAFSVTLEENHIAGNNTNIHGYGAGIIDVTAHSPNLYIRNFLEGNKCSTFNNGNYWVPFNSADANNLALPVKTVFNGNFSNISTNEGLENIVVEYSQEPEFYPYDSLTTVPIHPDIVSYLTSNNCWA